jgi:succinate dehydrogenase/fumarate reductase-like Fe-S protein
MPFENIIDLQVRAFFFNAATDYLPYYKNFNISINKSARLLDVLDRIKAKNPDFSFPNKNVILKVNNQVTTTDITLEYIINSLGSELQIDPALTYRSNNGLILNDDDFMESFELLAPYATEEDKTYYESLYTVHYASETTNYNRQYIGDAILLLASKMIADGHENKEAILAAISDEYNGIRCCEYENNVLNGEDHTKAIDALKAMLTLKDTATCFDKFTCAKKDHSIDMETLKNSNVALYSGLNKNIDGIQTLIENNAASYVAFDKSAKLAGQTLMETHFEMAHLKAGAMLLDALDSGADILVCTKRDVTIFQDSLASAERSMGRDIKLKIISAHTLKELCTVNA